MHKRDRSIATLPTEAKEPPKRGELYFLWYMGTDYV